MITYREIGNGTIQVLLAGRMVGDIQRVLTGYRYFPKGSNVGGNAFSTISEVKHSLENESEVQA